jgi:hypothetical protein
MNIIKSQLMNPWVIAAAAGGGAWFAVNQMKPALVFGEDGALKNPMISPMTIAAAVSIAVLSATKMGGIDNMFAPQRPSMQIPRELASSDNFRI